MFFLQLPGVDVDKIAAADSTAKMKVDQWLHRVMDMTPEEIMSSAITGTLEVIWKIIVALVVYYIGRWIIRRVQRIIGRIFKRRKVDDSLQIFLQNSVNVLLTIILLIIIVDILGFNTTGFVAILASIGLAIGMALSGTLQNFAGGVMVLLLNPYRNGDYIETQGYEGTVKNIQLFNTVIRTPENQNVIIPNGTISTSTIKNYTREPTRRAQWIIPMDYGDNFEEAKEAIIDILEADPRVLKEPSYSVVLYSFDDSYISIRIRAWAQYSEYWAMYFDVNARFFADLPSRGVNFPYNQLDVTIKSESNGEEPK